MAYIVRMTHDDGTVVDGRTEYPSAAEAQKEADYLNGSGAFATFTVVEAE